MFERVSHHKVVCVDNLEEQRGGFLWLKVVKILMPLTIGKEYDAEMVVSVMGDHTFYSWRVVNDTGARYITSLKYFRMLTDEEKIKD